MKLDQAQATELWHTMPPSIDPERKEVFCFIVALRDDRMASVDRVRGGEQRCMVIGKRL